ncbi:TolC family protein [Dyadobacter sandarakinus]|uniref:TolC family protein n=1 Tax=Dyadobacter sandarakinus TaxID=2747268 RepID=A0ABX7I3K7_9BACT|nr:TolC family protein [Dyadobacter sandarakinus]QRR00473.1 TolC family protein [Dyadobacter sandarakinus]
MISIPKIRGFLLGASLAVLCAGESQAQDDPLPGYIRTGLSNNQGLKQENLLLEKSLYALKEAKSYFLPEVNFSTSYLDARGGRKISIPIGDLLNPVYRSLNELTSSGAFPQVENVNQTFNPNNYYDAKVRTSVPLYNAEIMYNARIRREQITMQQAGVDVYKRELVRDIKVAYYAWIQARQAAGILESAVELARENLRFNQVLVKNDKAIRTVVSRSENELIGLQARLEDARYQSVNAAGYFNFLLNRPLDTAIEAAPAHELPVSIDSITDGKREELTRLETVSHINQLSEQLVRAAVIPRLSTFLDLGSQGDFANFNKDTRYYLFGLTLDWRIFAGNRTQYQLRKAALDSKVTDEQLSQTSRQFELQALTASNRLQSSIVSYRASRNQTALSQQYYGDQQKRYREGQLLYIELLDAQNRLINDQLQQSIALLNVQTRAAELERARASFVFND